jgi:hypothetical protein
MKEFKGTPAPWKTIKSRAENELHSYWYILSEEENGWGKWIADAKYPELFEGTPKQAEANAYLISAAPELLEALQNIIKKFEYAMPNYGEDEIEQAKKAINKALNL